jgi:uncharacterized membrane protein
LIGRLRAGELVAGTGGLALLLAMLLDWYAPDLGLTASFDLGLDAWESFSVLDVVLALLALVPLALVVLQATRDSPSLPVAFSVLTTLAGVLAALLILYRIINQPGPNDVVEVELGAWIGFTAAVAVATGGWLSMRAEAMPGVPQPPVEDMPAPAP